MQTRSIEENSVCLMICPSVKRVDCDKTGIFILYERTYSLVTWEKEWLVEATPSTWNWGFLGQPIPVGAKSPNLNRYSLIAAQPYNLAKKFN